MRDILFHIIHKINLFFSYQGIPLGIILILAIVVCRNILFCGGFPAGGDMPGWIGRVQFFSEAAMTGGPRFPIWSPESFGGLTFFSLDWLLAMLNYVFRNSALLISGFIFISFLLSGVFMYWLVYRYTQRRLPSLAAALIYVLNQYYVMIVATTGHLDVFAAYALFPLILITLDSALIKGKLRSIIVFSFLVFVLFMLIRVDQLLYYMPILIVFALFAVIFPHNGMPRKTASLHLTKVILIGGVFATLLAAFQILPSIQGALTQGLTWGGRGATIEMHQNYCLPLFETLLLGKSVESHFVAGQSLSFPYLSSTLFYLLSAVPVILAFSAVLFRRDRMILALTVSTLILLFMAKGSHAPLGQVYWWLFDNVPYFSSLRCANRWLQPTWLCYAFLGGFAIDQIYHRLRGFPRGGGLLKKVYSKLPHICVILLLLPLLFISWYSIANGLPVWQPAKQEVEPHLWLAQQPGDFMVVTVPYAEGWMRLSPELGSNDLRTTTDLGLVSYYYHNQRVMGAGGNQFLSKLFTRYTAGLLYWGEIEDLIEMLGTFNVKYIVLQGYPSQWKEKPYQDNPHWQRDHFEQQQQLRLVYDNGTAQVYELESWTPKFFSPSEVAVVVGGKNTVVALNDMENFTINQWGLLSYSQVSNALNPDQLFDIMNKSRAVIFPKDSDLFNLAMITLDDCIRIRAVDYAYPSSTATEHWISSEWAVTKMGMSVLNDTTLSSYGNNQVSIPINVEGDGHYELWVRLIVGLNRGELTVSLNGREIGRVIPYAEQYSDLRWIQIGTVELESGNHMLELQNTVLTTHLGMGNSIDEIVLVKPNSLQVAMGKVYGAFQSSPTRIISFLDFQQALPIAVFGENIICNDAQTSFWQNANPAYVVLSDDSEIKVEDSQNSLKIDIQQPGMDFFTLVSKSYSPMQDWRDTEDIAFWFRGNSTGEPFSLVVYFNYSLDDYAKFTITDTSNEWREFVFTTDYPSSSHGTPDWSKVSILKFTSYNKDINSSFYIDRVVRSNNERAVTYNTPKAGDYGLALYAEHGPGLGTLNINVGGTTHQVNLSTSREINTFNIANDTQTDFWSNANPGQVILVDDNGVKIDKDSQNSLKMSISSGRRFYTLLQHFYTQAEDFSQNKYLRFWFKGEDSGLNYILTAFSNPTAHNTDSASFYWIDDSTEWKRLVFPLANPSFTKGSIDWSKICALKLSTDMDKDLVRIAYVDHVSLYNVIETEPEWKWVNLEPPITLSTGDNTITFQAPEGGVTLGQMVLYSLEEKEGNIPIGDLFTTITEENPVLSYEMINSTKYVVHVEKATEPFWLMFSESYHPLWRAYVDGEEINPVPAYSFINTFYLTKTGEYDVVIEFTGQRYVHWGGIISLSSLLAASSLIILEWKWPLWRRRKKKD